MGLADQQQIEQLYGGAAEGIGNPRGVWPRCHQT